MKNAAMAEAELEEVETPVLRLNPDLDIAGLADEYAARGRVRIQRLLEYDGVAAFYHHLNNRGDWWHLIHTSNGVIELDRESRETMTPERAAEIEAIVQAGARTGFQYRYEGLRVPNDAAELVAAAEDPLGEFARLMSSEPMLEMLRAVTGCQELAFTDGHATAYGPGDFLTGHDDNVVGKNRLAAYVFGMTPKWRPEYGGLLLFHSADEGRVEGEVPRFNTLDLFKVPQRHSVSMVTTAAPHRRFAVTGWLRSGQR
jgi:Rps23 Pro-64 3,4-dihydroxylase Tpa1-like proline 4-hydroxylase